jgi:hypothetical protein
MQTHTDTKHTHAVAQRTAGRSLSVNRGKHDDGRAPRCRLVLSHHRQFSKFRAAPLLPARAARRHFHAAQPRTDTQPAARDSSATKARPSKTMLSSAAQTAALASPQRTDATVATARAATAPAAPQQASADAPAPADELQRKLSLYREALLDVSVGSEAALDETLAQLRAVAAANGAGVTVMRLRGGGGADVLVRKLEGETQTELRIAVIGNVDAGKSTLISVLVAAQLDDGRGAARRKILHHPHEQETGRTSSISQHSMLFAADGASLTDATHRAAVSEELVNAASKIVTLVRPAAVASLRCRCDTMLSPTGRLVRPRALPAHNLLRADRAQTGLRPCHRRRQRWPGRQCAPRSVAACASRMC